MSYKRVVRKEGKTYGPYRYESYRDKDGKVKKRYLGKIEDRKEKVFSKKSKEIKDKVVNFRVNKKVFFLIAFGFFLLVTLFIFSKFVSITGFIVSNESEIESDVFEIESKMVEQDGVATLQYKAVINKPVKWIKKLTSKNSSLRLPKVAEKIVVLKDDEIDDALVEAVSYEERLENFTKEDIVEISPITGNVIVNEKGLVTRFWNWLKGRGVTGNVISESQLGDEIVETAVSKIVNLENVVEEDEEVAVEYVTEAPKADEIVLSNGKRIVVSAPSELGYTDVLAYSVVEGMGIRMDNPNLKVYWYEDMEDNIVYDESLESEIVNETIEEIEEVVEENETVETVENNSEISIDNETEVLENVSEVENSSVENVSEVENSSVETVDVVIEENETVETVEENQDDIIEEGENLELNDESEEQGEVGNSEEEISLSPLTGNVVSAGVGDEVEDEIVKNKAKLDNEVAKYLNPNVKMDRVRREVAFMSYDFDNDGYVDYIEWIVPHLSVQVYEIVYVNRAEHLDVNRSFVSDVYNEIENKDGIFTDPINDGEYLRVVFEREIGSKNDITIYAKSEGVSDLEVYTKNGNSVVAVFENIGGEDICKIYLSGLSGKQDVFDLKVLGSAVQFDYVVDPTPISLAIPQTFNVHGRLSNATGLLNGTFEFNFSLYDVYAGGSPIWNDSMSVTTDDDGVYSVVLNISGLDFSEQYYLGISVEGDHEMEPRLNLTSAPYAFMAQHVYVGGIVWDDNMDGSGYNITADVLIANDELNIGNGRMRWNSTNSVFEYYNGSGWIDIVGNGTSSGGGDSIWTNESGVAVYDGAVVIKL